MIKCTLCQDIGWVRESHPGKRGAGRTPVPATRPERHARDAISMMGTPRRACRRGSWSRSTRTVRGVELWSDDFDDLAYPEHCRSLSWLRNQSSVANFVSDRISVACLGGALMPNDRPVDPVVRTPRIGLRLLTTGRSVNQTLFPLIHHVRLGFSPASVTELSHRVPRRTRSRSRTRSIRP
jgi:hypothetical protein